MPGIADNALVKAAPLIERLGGYRPEPRDRPRGRGASSSAIARRACREPREVVARAVPSTRSRPRLVEPLLS